MQAGGCRRHIKVRQVPMIDPPFRIGDRETGVIINETEKSYHAGKVLGPDGARPAYLTVTASEKWQIEVSDCCGGARCSFFFKARSAWSTLLSRTVISMVAGLSYVRAWEFGRRSW